MMNFRGALVTKTSDQSLETGSGIVEFEYVVYDTANITDSMQPTKLTVPRRASIVKLTANLDLANADYFYRVGIQQNGRYSLPGLPCVNISRSPDVRTRINLVSAPLEVTEGDFFEVYVNTNENNIVVDHTWSLSWFSMEIISVCIFSRIFGFS